MDKVLITVLMLLFAFTQMTRCGVAETWFTDMMKQKLNGRYSSSFGESERSSATQRRQIIDLRGGAVNTKSRRKVFRRRTSTKCFITGSSVHCDGGLKFRSVGSAGRQGSPGLPGPKGERGFRGSPGRPGFDGPPGERGQRGRKGSQGSQGMKGDKGDRGRRGAQGYPSIPSNCKLVPHRSYYCPVGNGGPLGSKGTRGKQGDFGQKGDIGHTGEGGEKGSRGASGVPGSIGLYGALRINGSCRELYSNWVIPSLSPIGQLKTECAYREYLLSLKIEADKDNDKIRYKYKCCPFRAADLPVSIM